MKKEFQDKCQVATPLEIVDLIWSIVLGRRNHDQINKVLDLGAGDARFSYNNSYKEYLGIEIDKSKIDTIKNRPNVTIVNTDALKIQDSGFDLCIGNPPYIRHHYLDPIWREDVLSSLKKECGVSLKKTANVFVYFLLQAILRTNSQGLIVQLIPFEWVTRPSAKELREYIHENGWGVSVIRFKEDIFPRVLTTASITIIDKATTERDWFFGEVDTEGNISQIESPSGTSNAVLSYSERNSKLYGLRGLSPGGQDIFSLTEEQRLYYQLDKNRDVRPCVTTLRHLPSHVLDLNADSFHKYFIEPGKRCWLIRSDQDNISNKLTDYLIDVGEKWKKYSTCANRHGDWWKYRPHPAPELLFSSGFVGKTTKVLTNSIEAIALGSVYGIISSSEIDLNTVTEKLRNFDFESRVVSHSNNLKKVEVKQLNSVLASFIK